MIPYLTVTTPTGPVVHAPVQGRAKLTRCGEAWRPAGLDATSGLASTMGQVAKLGELCPRCWGEGTP